MLSVTAVAGNIFSGKAWAEKYRRARAAGKAEKLLISRLEMDRLRLRGTTDKGSDVGLVLESRLRHGDVIYSRGKIIVVEQIPERTISIRIKKSAAKEMLGLAALVGHTIGNRHRPIAVDGKTITFPVQAESEIAVFRKLLPAGLELKVRSKVFQPTVEVHGHE